MSVTTKKAAGKAAKKAAAGTGAAEAMTQVVGTALGLAAVAGVSLIAVGVVLDTLFEDVADKETAAKVKSAYKKLLSECKVGDKHIDSILRVTDFSGIKLTDDGSLDGVDALKEKINSDWSGFISTSGTKGADVETPPGDGNPDSKKTGRAAEIAAKYHDNLYGKVKEG